jgi:glyoxylase-like metal-dependent hydrolase (beta-lactamase superfamily II)
VQELYEGVRRVTFRLPLGITHVHCYLLRSSSGGWTLVDSSLGAEDPEATWAPILAALDAPVERVVITHFHPDHAGGTRDVEALTGAPVLQGREDHAQCVRAWGPERSPERLADYMVEHGMPREEVREYVRESSWLGARVRYAESPQLVDEGDEIDGWRVLVLRGHADGHIVLLRDGVLVAGDTILAEISPAVGLYPLARPDPLGDYLASLRRIVELAPRLALPGHGPPIEDPASRARELLDHHGDRLAQTESALGPRPRRAYEISHELWSDLSPSQRRFALAEALAHLERLVAEGRAERAGENAYVAARAAG